MKEDLMIPEAKQPAVTRALRATLDTEHVDDIGLLAGGLTTALVFRIVVRGTPYLLRLITRTDAMGDPTRQYANMQAAAEAGIAPRIRYASIEDRLMISDFIVPKTFPQDMGLRIARVIRHLHDLPKFPRTISYLDAMDGVVRRFQAAKILPESETEELLRNYAELARIYPRNDSDQVASHNDMKPPNILFDGERIWLIDWEAAFLNDRYLDLAVAANFFVDDQAAGEYLQAYFGEPAGAYRSARFYLMRQLLHVFYPAFLLPLAASNGIAIDLEKQYPSFEEFHRRLVSFEVDIADDKAKVEYAIVHLNRAVENLRTAQYAAALALVASADPCA
jgi:thiamine kinase-like enzyme